MSLSIEIQQDGRRFSATPPVRAPSPKDTPDGPPDILGPVTSTITTRWASNGGNEGTRRATCRAGGIGLIVGLCVTVT